MRDRLPLILSATALMVAVFGATPLGHAARDAVPFAKSANYAKLAGNAQKLNGRKSTLSGAPRTIPVVGVNGKLPASIGAVGPQGPKGDRGEKGTKGDPGNPGLSGYELVTQTLSVAANTGTAVQATCPTGKKVIGGGGGAVGLGSQADVFVAPSIILNGSTYSVMVVNKAATAKSVFATAICATVAT